MVEPASPCERVMQSLLFRRREKDEAPSTGDGCALESGCDGEGEDDDGKPEADRNGEPSDVSPSLRRLSFRLPVTDFL